MMADRTSSAAPALICNQDEEHRPDELLRALLTLRQLGSEVLHEPIPEPLLAILLELDDQLPNTTHHRRGRDYDH